MLILTRNPRESLVIDGRIIVTVVDVAGGRVRLAIDAPEEVPVHRREVHDRIQQARRLAPAACKADALCHASS